MISSRGTVGRFQQREFVCSLKESVETKRTTLSGAILAVPILPFRFVESPLY